MKKIAIYGAGGFGREVLTLINDINRINHQYQVIGFFDDGISVGSNVNGFTVLGGIKELNAINEAVSVILAIGNLLGNISNPLISFPTVIHPSVMIGDKERVAIGKGCIICGGTIITTDIAIKDFVILNLACTVGHDTVINNYSAFMPSVNISGEVEIGEAGDNTIIGAGAVVAKDLPANCTAVGVPAKVIKFH